MHADQMKVPSDCQRGPGKTWSAALGSLIVHQQVLMQNHVTSAARPDQSSEDITELTRRRVRRRLTLAALIVGLIATAFLSFVILVDVEEPDIRDLLPRPRQTLPPEQNLYLRLAELGRALEARPVVAEERRDETAAPPQDFTADMADAAPSEGEVSLPTRYWLEGKVWERPRLRDTLMKGESWTKEHLAEFGPGLAQVAAQARALSELTQTQGTEWIDVNTSIPSEELRVWARHLCMAAEASLATGDRETGFELLGLGLGYGRAVRDGSESWIDWLTGVAMMGMFEEAVARRLSDPDLKAHEAAALAEIMAQASAGGAAADGFENAFRGEAWLTQRILRDVTPNSALGVGNAMEVAARTRVFFPLIYKPNLTRTLHAEHARHWLTLARLYPVEAHTKRVSPSECPHCVALETKQWLRPSNLMGRYMLSIVSTGYDKLAVTRWRVLAKRETIQAAIAVRRFELARGHRPQRLAELVPEYLASEPLDFADGQALRYDAAEGVLWSVGVSGKSYVPDRNQKPEGTDVVLWLSR
jgi:hypothetical protein